MRITLTILLILFSLASFSQSQSRVAQALNSRTYYFNVWSPADSAANPGKKYPVIFMLPGSGETGGSENTQALANKYGPARQISNGTWNGTVAQGDSTTGFYSVTIQASTETSEAWRMSEAIEWFLNTSSWVDNVDTMQLHVTGISLGGINIVNMLVNDTAFYNYRKFTTTVLFSPGGSHSTITARFPNLSQYAGYSGNLLTLSGSTDAGVYHASAFTSYMAGRSLGRDWQLVDGFQNTNHCCWDTGYSYSRTWDFLAGKTLYEWMFSKTKAPSATAEDTITTSLDNVTLHGVTNGWNKVIEWTTSDGATIGSNDADTTAISNIPSGFSSYQLKVTNGINTGTFATHTVVINRIGDETGETIFRKKRLSKYVVE